MQELDLAGVRMRDLGSAFAAASWASLTSLDVSRNLLVSLAPLRHLPALRILNASCNRLAACPGPIFDTHATANADGTAIAQAAPPGEGGGHGGGPLLPCLEVLQVGDNALADLEALQLARLPALRSLFLQGNALTRLEGVAGLPRLQELVRQRPLLCQPSVCQARLQGLAPSEARVQVLDGNRIKALPPGCFAGLPALREVRCADNGVRTLRAFASLPSLQALHLPGNRVADADEVAALASCRSLAELSLAGCPLARRPGYRGDAVGRLAALQVLDDVAVSAEERAAAALALAPPPGPLASLEASVSLHKAHSAGGVAAAPSLGLPGAAVTLDGSVLAARAAAAPRSS